MKFTLNSFLLLVLVMLTALTKISVDDIKKDCRTVTFITARVINSDMNHIRIVHEKHELCI
jgi:hypothetical protein